MEFGERFKKIRLENNLTQTQVANALGIDQTNISLWENDKTRPEYEHLIHLSKLYDVTLDELLGIEDFTLPKK
jgi:transcriptional regulator with XRE-family HTH domain